MVGLAWDLKNGAFRISAQKITKCFFSDVYKF